MLSSRASPKQIGLQARAVSRSSSTVASARHSSTPARRHACVLSHSLPTPVRSEWGPVSPTSSSDTQILETPAPRGRAALPRTRLPRRPPTSRMQNVAQPLSLDRGGAHTDSQRLAGSDGLLGLGLRDVVHVEEVAKEQKDGADVSIVKDPAEDLPGVGVEARHVDVVPH